MAVFDNDFFDKEREIREKKEAEELARKNAEQEAENRRRAIYMPLIKDALIEFPDAATKMGTKLLTINLRDGRRGGGPHRPTKVWEIGENCGFHSNHAVEDETLCSPLYIGQNGKIYGDFTRTIFKTDIRQELTLDEAANQIYGVIRGCQKIPASHVVKGNLSLPDTPGNEKQIVQQFFLRSLNYKGGYYY